MTRVKFDDGTTGYVDDLTFEAYFADPPKQDGERTYPIHGNLRVELEVRDKLGTQPPITGVSGRTAYQWAVKRKPPGTVKAWELRRAEYLARKA